MHSESYTKIENTKRYLFVLLLGTTTMMFFSRLLIALLAIISIASADDNHGRHNKKAVFSVERVPSRRKKELYCKNR